MSCGLLPKLYQALIAFGSLSVTRHFFQNIKKSLNTQQPVQPGQIQTAHRQGYKFAAGQVAEIFAGKGRDKGPPGF